MAEKVTDRNSNVKKYIVGLLLVICFVLLYREYIYTVGEGPLTFKELDEPLKERTYSCPFGTGKVVQYKDSEGDTYLFLGKKVY